jgi:hypothetical protein
MTETQQVKKKLNLPYLISIFGGIGSIIATIIVYIVCIPAIEAEPDNVDLFEYVFLSNFAYIIQFVIAIWACITFFLVLKMYSIGSKPGKAWLFLLIGIIAWTFAESWYMFEYLFTRNETYEQPTPMSWFYYAGYAFLTLGLLFQARLLPSILKKGEKIAIIGVGIAVLTIWLIIVAPALGTSYIAEELTDWDIIAVVIYLLGDLAYIVFSLYLVFEFKGGSFSKSWLILVAGFLTMAAFDIFNALFYYAWNLPWIYWLDFLYMAFYVILAIGAAHLLKSSK